MGFKKDPNYNPNIHPWKVFKVLKDGDEFQIRSYTTKEKAENYALQMSQRNKNMIYRVKKIIIEKG